MLIKWILIFKQIQFLQFYTMVSTVFLLSLRLKGMEVDNKNYKAVSCYAKYHLTLVYSTANKEWEKTTIFSDHRVHLGIYVPRNSGTGGLYLLGW